MREHKILHIYGKVTTTGQFTLWDLSFWIQVYYRFIRGYFAFELGFVRWHPGGAHQVCCVGRVSDGWSGCNIQQRPLKRQVLWRGRGGEQPWHTKRDTPSGWSHTETASVENLTHLISKTFCTDSSAEFHPQLITLCALLSVKSLKSLPDRRLQQSRQIVTTAL